MVDIAPVIIAVAPNGARKAKTDHPGLPVTPVELAQTARACRDAGAAMIHLHVRDDDGGHSLDADRYRAAIAAVRDAVGDDLIIQMTSEAAGVYAPAQQIAAVRAVVEAPDPPEGVSLAIRELVAAGDGAAENKAQALFSDLYARRIFAQYILYSAEDLARFRDLVARGVVPGERHSVLFVLGRYAAGGSTLEDLAPFLSAGTDGLLWMVCAFGAAETRMMAQAQAQGGHCRVGFENNLLLPDGTTAPDNAALVAETARLAVEAGRKVADAALTRELFRQYL